MPIYTIHAPLIAEAAALAGDAYLQLAKSLLRLDAAELEPAPEAARAIETIGDFANSLTAIADDLGREAVAQRYGTGDPR